MGCRRMLGFFSLRGDGGAHMCLNREGEGLAGCSVLAWEGISRGFMCSAGIPKPNRARMGMARLLSGNEMLTDVSLCNLPHAHSSIPLHFSISPLFCHYGTSPFSLMQTVPKLVSQRKHHQFGTHMKQLSWVWAIWMWSRQIPWKC